jgi:hypothetical protein
LRKWLAAIFIGLLIFAFTMAFWDAGRIALINGLGLAGNSTYIWATDVWTSIASTPIYQTYHVLIWVVGGVLLAYGVHQLHAKNKIPLLQKQTVAQPVYQNAPTPQPPIIINTTTPAVPIVPATEKKQEATA